MLLSWTVLRKSKAGAGIRNNNPGESMANDDSHDYSQFSDEINSPRTKLLDLLDSRHSFLISKIILRRYLALELCEVDENKYYISEQVHHDIGIDTAAVDFADNHGQRFREAYERNKAVIHDYCNRVCGQYACRGIGKCLSTNQEIHQLLQD